MTALITYRLCMEIKFWLQIYSGDTDPRVGNFPRVIILIKGFTLRLPLVKSMSQNHFHEHCA